MTEAQLQRAVIDLTRWLGLLAFHSTDARRDTSAGFPDLVISGVGGVLYRELKSDTGRLRPEQMTWLSTLHLGGADAAVWRPADMVSGRIKTELVALTKGKP